MLSEKDGTPSTKRVLFCGAVFSSIAYCAVHVIAHRGLDAILVDLAKAILIATAPTYAIGRFAENAAGTPPAQTPPIT